MSRPIVLTLLVLGCACGLPAASFTENFNSGLLNANLVVTGSPGFGISFSGGRAQFDEASGFVNGSIYLETSFRVTGDFTTTVQVDRTGLGFAELGLLVGNSDGYADVFFVGSSGINGNIFFPGFSYGSVGNSDAAVTFRIRRVGSTIFDEFDNGSGFVTVHSLSTPSTSGPLSLTLIMTEEFGAGGPHHGSFDNWTIDADGFDQPIQSAVPEPSTVLLLGSGAVTVMRRLWRNR